MAAIGFTTYEAQGQPGRPVPLRERYDNSIGGAWTAPTSRGYPENPTQSSGEPFCKVPIPGRTTSSSRSIPRKRPRIWEAPWMIVGDRRQGFMR